MSSVLKALLYLLMKLPSLCKCPKLFMKMKYRLFSAMHSFISYTYTIQLSMFTQLFPHCVQQTDKSDFMLIVAFARLHTVICCLWSQAYNIIWVNCHGNQLNVPWNSMQKLFRHHFHAYCNFCLFSLLPGVCSSWPCLMCTNKRRQRANIWVWLDNFHIFSPFWAFK
jgi:hypothetical protein